MTTGKTPATVRLRNINPLGAVDLPLLRREGEPYGQEGAGCLEAGEEFDCPADLAGRAPSLVDDDPDQQDEAGNPVQTWDLGEGLLAQTENYELVDTTTSKASKRSSKTASSTVPNQTPGSDQ